MRSNGKYLVGAAVVVAGLAFGANSFQSALTPYVSVAEVQRSQGMVQVSGLLADYGTYDKEGNFAFTMKDDQGNTLKVVYKHPRPANLEQATGVVAIGRYEAGAFQADTILVKCPSKYEEKYGDPDAGTSAVGEVGK